MDASGANIAVYRPYNNNKDILGNAILYSAIAAVTKSYFEINLMMMMMILVRIAFA